MIDDRRKKIENTFLHTIKAQNIKKIEEQINTTMLSNVRSYL